MASLALFPSRIRFVNADGTLSSEAMRFLTEIYNRVGGALGDGGTDTFSIDSFAQDSGAASMGSGMVVQGVEFAPVYLSSISQPVQADYLADMVFAGETTGARLSVVTVGASPFVYQAQGPGVLSIEGGIVSALSLARAGISIALGQVAGVVPLGAGDSLAVTYTAVPNIHFIPR